MISPLSPYAIRGVVWSLGENGFGSPPAIKVKTEALITGWRKQWGQKSLPFYLELLPKMGAVTRKPCAGLYWAKIRQGQIEALALKNTCMAVTLDVADFGTTPRNRKDPGERLALCALVNEYGRNAVCNGPRYKSHRVEDSRIVISFDHVTTGLIVGEKIGFAPVKEAKNGELKQFVIAGADKKWHWADAQILGRTVVVSSKNVPNPVEVRYAYCMNPKGPKLYNQNGLPASPFISEKW